MSNKLKPDRSVIAAVPLFAGLEPSGAEAVLACAHVGRALKGESVFNQGETAAAFYVLLQGHVKDVQITSAGHQIVARYVNPKEFFGCASVMEIAHYPTTALAIKDSIILSWSAADMARLMRCHPSIALNALAGVGRQLADTLARAGAGHSERVSRRIARTLLHLIRTAGCQLDTGIKIDFPISRQDLAEMTGTTLYTVSRTLSKWQKIGVLRSSRQAIVVINPHKLVELAGDQGIARARHHEIGRSGHDKAAAAAQVARRHHSD
jgi:CRP-like cAMP-binding protein